MVKKNDDLIILIENDMRIFWRDASTGRSWTKWKLWKDCTKQEQEQANLRELRKDEIVLDDDKGLGNNILKLLDKDNYKKRIVVQSNKGIHIHLFFENLANLNEEERTGVRKLFIKRYSCDESKASENTLISIENRPHHKNPKLICKILEKK